ncbi:hypothetical protein HMPREF1869_00980 [Bacteroidales bacterium KA00251]|nr:hypothetical protein HMPREF1869_00980 [Bacteroidales bacterium KA00251]
MFREIFGNVPRDFLKCSERFSEMFREIYWKDLELFCKEKISV